MSEIQVNLDALSALAEGVRTAQGMLGDLEDNQPWSADFTSGSKSAHRDFKGKWDERRDQLSDGLRSVADALEMIRDSFDQTEDDLVNTLNGEGDGG
ncbi:MAG: hypothetical protein AAGE88_03355 [Actinomycetota bacterium]